MPPSQRSASDSDTPGDGFENQPDAIPTIVYMVDDHQVELDLMQRWCHRAGYQTRVFDRPEHVIPAIDCDAIGCIVADLKMPKISGLELQTQLRDEGIDLPVILVTGFGDAENCRKAFQQGAFDFIEKGFDADVFLNLIETAIHSHRRDRLQNRVRQDAQKLLRTISPRENDVMVMLARGATLKVVAQQLKISVQTASKHRTSIFHKLQIDNEVDLFKALLAAGVDVDAGVNVDAGAPVEDS